MKFFRKKQNSEPLQKPDYVKEDETPEEKTKFKKASSAKEEFPYNVILWDIWGTASKMQFNIPVRRYVEDNVVYLYNEKYMFKERIPEDTDDYREHKLEQLEEQIKQTEKLIKQIKDGKSNDSLSDAKTDLKQYNNWVRSIELQGRGSYLNLDMNGKPIFMFDRKGNLKVPIYKNVEYSMLYAPEETKIKEVTALLKENEEKNGDPNNSIKVINVILTVILALLVISMGWVHSKQQSIPEDITYKLLNASNHFNEAAKAFRQGSENLEITTDKSVQPDPVKVDPRLNTVS